ncbi:putative plastidic glucose transporter 1 [Cucumis melo var. makuwa]|uniref:Probable plastidic glucose transporter 1 n=2 Tax=Cucumis melo TaxID=3656 RepID=A0A1S3C4G2_CUCME|nr:probable plastidic glucose transporter 1 [Cucumis melo]XP_050935610.1 probable plastidic glucose transporter 1 [Cucumis melo]XP_050935611.1 probable plastidic glucose transporter 1 [Cucumis melo]TYK14584.1 putative plastidic glucose transporter 1 [Cucumis melo var. makuwa]
MRVIPLLHFPVPPAPAITIARRHSIPPSYDLSRHGSFPLRSGFRYMFRSIRKFEVLATNKQLPELRNGKSESEEGISLRAEDGDSFDLGWLPAFPHVLVASMSNFLFGYHIGVMNGPIISIARELGFEGNSILEGLVVSIFIVGAFLGSISSGSLLDKLGFRRTFQIATIPLILGALLSAQAHTLDEVLWGRFLVGLGIGVNTVLVPIYISEVAPTKYRGTLGGLCQIGTCLGIIASLFLGIPSENDPHWWRTMLYIASLPGFFIAFGMQFAVESPRWLSKAGRLDEARVVICNLWGESEVERAVEEFQSVIRNDGSDLNSGWSVLLEEQNFRVAFIGGALFFLQQFAGINGVLYFSSLTFEDVGITNVALASLVIGITNFAGALCALYLMDKQGRQRLLIGSYLGMAVSMLLIVSTISFQFDEELSRNLSIVGTIAYIFSFAIGAGPVTGIIIPELSSTRARGKIMGFSLAVHWVCNFTVGLFFLDLVQTFGVAPVYSGFGAFSLVAAIFSKYFLVETKGRSLEEIEMALNPNFNGSDK